jgi:hypothetical protein
VDIKFNNRPLKELLTTHNSQGSSDVGCNWHSCRFILGKATSHHSLFFLSLLFFSIFFLEKAEACRAN